MLKRYGKFQLSEPTSAFEDLNSLSPISYRQFMDGLRVPQIMIAEQ